MANKKEKIVQVLCYDLLGFQARMKALTDAEHNVPKHSAVISICPAGYVFGESHFFDDGPYVLNMDFDDGGPTEYWKNGEDHYDDLFDYWLEFGEFTRHPSAFDFQSKEKPEVRIHFMDYNDAYRCVKFIDRVMNDDDIDIIYVHCTAGVSRSQGVVRYIIDEYDHNGFKIVTRENNPCMTPNPHVVLMLKRAGRLFFDRKDVRGKYEYLVKETQDSVVPKKNVYEIIVKNDFDNHRNDYSEETTYDIDDLFEDELWFLLLCYFSDNFSDEQLSFCAPDKKSRKNICGRDLMDDVNFPWLYDYFKYYGMGVPKCPHPLRLYCPYYDSECNVITDITVYHWLEDGSRNLVNLPKMPQLFKTREEMVEYMTGLFNKKNEDNNA